MDRRVISRGGRHYVVLYRQGAAQFRYELCRRKPGATPLKAAAVQTRDVVAGRAAAQVARGPEDRVVVAGQLDAPPSAAWVVDDEPYVVLLRKRIRREEREPALRLLGSNRASRHRLLAPRWPVGSPRPRRVENSSPMCRML